MPNVRRSVKSSCTVVATFVALSGSGVTAIADQSGDSTGSTAAAAEAQSQNLFGSGPGQVDAGVQSHTPTQVGSIQASGPDPVKTCQAYLSEEAPPPTEKKKKRPGLFLAKALASELKTDGKNMLEDTAFVFSAKDFDPYARSAPTDKPYTALELTLVDGSQAQVIKYPDGSAKIVGSYLDKTVICPNGTDNFIVAYPNNVRSQMVRVNSDEYKIYRPDKTITYMKKTASGAWSVSNDKIGFMGTARPDFENLQFELNSSSF
ncbi:MAG TPA: hypothetical protein V6C72_15225 [Chroococcales cyanobacterium]